MRSADSHWLKGDSSTRIWIYFDKVPAPAIEGQSNFVQTPSRLSRRPVRLPSILNCPCSFATRKSLLYRRSHKRNGRHIFVLGEGGKVGSHRLLNDEYHFLRRHAFGNTKMGLVLRYARP